MVDIAGKVFARPAVNGAFLIKSKQVFTAYSLTLFAIDNGTDNLDDLLFGWNGFEGE
jgi:hypothetical protein